MQYRVIKSRLYCAVSSNIESISDIYLASRGYRGEVVGYHVSVTHYRVKITGYRLIYIDCHEAVTSYNALCNFVFHFSFNFQLITAGFLCGGNLFFWNGNPSSRNRYRYSYKKPVSLCCKHPCLPEITPI